MVRSITMAALVCASALALAVAPASAAAKSKSTTTHHSLAGTLEKVDGQTLTIKTSTQSQSVTVGAATHITQHGRAIQASQLSSDTGSHVTVKYTEANGQKQAQTVTVTPASTKTAKK